MSANKRHSAATQIYSQFNPAYKQNTAVEREQLIERMYFRVLAELATNRFKWYGMPSSVDCRYLELTEFFHALSVFYFDKRYDKYFALRGGGTNWNNMQDNPVGFSVIGAGAGFTGMNVSAVRETENASIAIPIWANYLRIPDLDIVTIYANRLANLDRTIEINSANARRTKVLTLNENQRLSGQNISRQIDEGQPAISVVNGPLEDMRFIQALDLGVNPDTIEKMHIIRTREWNECMGLLGIENANQDKKERLVAAEVDANDDQTSMMRYVNLNARRQAAEQINAQFGLNVSVEYNTDVDRRAQELEDSVLNNDGSDSE